MMVVVVVVVFWSMLVGVRVSSALSCWGCLFGVPIVLPLLSCFAIESIVREGDGTANGLQHQRLVSLAAPKAWTTPVEKRKSALCHSGIHQDARLRRRWGGGGGEEWNGEGWGTGQKGGDVRESMR